MWALCFTSEGVEKAGLGKQLYFISVLRQVRSYFLHPRNANCLSSTSGSIVSVYLTIGITDVEMSEENRGLNWRL